MNSTIKIIVNVLGIKGEKVERDFTIELQINEYLINNFIIIYLIINTKMDKIV
jgi:hypothetical protein